MKLALTCTIVLLAIAAGQAWHYSPLLPDQIASHFGAGGEPNGWQSNRGFFLFYGVMLTVMVASFFALPLSFKRIPASMFNLPNKDHWLSVERKDATVRDLQTRMAWCGVATLLFMVVIFQLVIKLNLTQPPVLPESTFWILITAYMIFIVGWIASLWMVYKKPPL